MLSKKNVKNIFNENHNINKGTFMYKLHEDDFFDEKEFLKYCEAVCVASQKEEEYLQFFPQIINDMSYTQACLSTHLYNLNKNPKGWKVKYHGEGIINYKKMTIDLYNTAWCIFNIISKLSFISVNTITLDEVYEALDIEGLPD